MYHGVIVHWTAVTWREKKNQLVFCSRSIFSWARSRSRCFAFLLAQAQQLPMLADCFSFKWVEWTVSILTTDALCHYRCEIQQQQQQRKQMHRIQKNQIWFTLNVKLNHVKRQFLFIVGYVLLLYSNDLSWSSPSPLESRRTRQEAIFTRLRNWSEWVGVEDGRWLHNEPDVFQLWSDGSWCTDQNQEWTRSDISFSSFMPRRNLWKLFNEYWWTKYSCLPLVCPRTAILMIIIRLSIQQNWWIQQTIENSSTSAHVCHQGSCSCKFSCLHSNQTIDRSSSL